MSSLTALQRKCVLLQFIPLLPCQLYREECNSDGEKDKNKNGQNLLMTHKIPTKKLQQKRTLVCATVILRNAAENPPSANVAEGHEIMKNSQTKAEKREETSVKPGERLMTASEAVAKPVGFQKSMAVLLGMT